MADQRSRYTGPPSGGGLPDREVQLHPGREVKLPPDHPWTLSLLERGLLVHLSTRATPTPDVPEGGKA